MKKLVEGLLQFKTSASFCFVGFIMIFTMVGLLTGQTGISFSNVFQSLGLSLLTPLLQLLFFTNHIIKRMSYVWRVVLFAAALYPLLIGSALLFDWFPVSLGSVATFSVIYFVILIILAVVFNVYFKVTGSKYKESLEAYKKEQNNA